MDSKRIGFISTRLAGTDGVSLETFKWAEVLERMGHECYFLAGELDTPPARSMLVPSCHFNHPGIMEIYEGCFDEDNRMPRISRKCDDMKGVLKQSIRDFVDHFDLDMIIPENAVTIPMKSPWEWRSRNTCWSTRPPVSPTTTISTGKGNDFSGMPARIIWPRPFRRASTRFSTP